MYDPTASPVDLFYKVLLIIWSILCLVLFFKIWGMTNNIKEIKQFLFSNLAKENETSKPKESVIREGFAPNTLVLHTESGRQMKIKYRLPNGKYLCSYNGGTLKAEVEESEIVLFEESKDKK